MAEAESLCDRIAIIINGKLAALGSPDEVTAKGSFQTRITIRTKKGNLTSQGNIKKPLLQAKGKQCLMALHGYSFRNN